jgi:hypothetical protein
MSATELEGLSDAYQAGSSIREIPQHFKINRTTAHAHTKRLGLGRHHPRLSGGDLQAATEMYRSGRSLKAVGTHFGVAGDTVGLALRKAGVEIRPNGRAKVR